MRTFDYVDNKLAETDFFLKRIEAIKHSWFEMRCYFSAFVSSSRSVTFAMQSSMKGVVGFESWYGERQAELRENRLARFFSDCRTDDQKIGFNHIVGGTTTDTGFKYFFGEPESGRYKYIPTTDVATTCRNHMVTICGIVNKAYQDFGLIIDPDQIYTPEGMSRLGITFADIEAELGLPENITKISWPHGNEDLHRLAALRRSIPGSGIKPLLQEYLGPELGYPIGPFTAPKI